MWRNEYKQAKTKYELWKLAVCVSTILPIYGSLFTCFSHLKEIQNLTSGGGTCIWQHYH